MTDIVELLADYFTGPLVVMSSVGLSLPGDRRVAAEAFFALRTAFGVSGYATRDEACVAIRRTLNTPLLDALG